MQKTMVLSSEIALLYLRNEFGNQNLKITVELDNDGCWKNKISISGTVRSSLKDDKEYLDFLSKSCYNKGVKER